MLFSDEKVKDIVKVTNDIDEFCKENNVRLARITYDRNCGMIIYVFKKDGAPVRYTISDVARRKLDNTENLIQKIKERIKILTKE